MKIIILDGYKNQNKINFTNFRTLIEQAINEQTWINLSEIEIIEREIDNLKEFLYDSESGFMHPSAGRNFDSLDIIIVSGESNLRPWEDKASQLLILLRMCLRTKKFLLCFSFSTECLVYIASTNIKKPISIINGKEGSKLFDMSLFTPEKLKSSTSPQYFLDNSSGDLYSFISSTEKWEFFINAGMHNFRSSTEYSQVGKYLINVPVFSKKQNLSLNGFNQIFKTKTCEVICSIKKQFYWHTLFAGLSDNKNQSIHKDSYNSNQLQFLIIQKSWWDIHEFSPTDKDMLYQVLVEGERGPLILQFGSNENIIGCQFDVLNIYPNTILIMKNWLFDKMQKFSVGEQSDFKIISLQFNQQHSKVTPPKHINQTHNKKLPIQRQLSLNIKIKHNKNIDYSNSVFIKNSSNMQLLKSSDSQQSQIYKSDHNTLTCQPKNNYNHENRSMSSFNILRKKYSENIPKKERKQQLNLNYSNKQEKVSFNDKYQTNSNNNEDGVLKIDEDNFYQQQQQQQQIHQIQIDQKSKKEIENLKETKSQSIHSHQQNENQKEIHEDEKDKQNQNEKQQHFFQNNNFISQDFQNNKYFSKFIVRTSLHPNIDKNNLPYQNEKLWVPGFLSQQKKTKFQHSESNLNNQTNTNQNQNEKDSPQNSKYNNKYSIQHKNSYIEKIKSKSFFDQISFYYMNAHEPYMSQQEFQNLDNKTQEKQILFHKSFLQGQNKINSENLKKKIEEDLIQHKQNQDKKGYYISAQDHQFRNIEKQKWKGQEFQRFF